MLILVVTLKSGTLESTAKGTYTFSVIADDGVTDAIEQNVSVSLKLKMIIM